jgi:enoyl-CoA hydratase
MNKRTLLPLSDVSFPVFFGRSGMEFQNILLSIDGDIATLTVNRPSVLNALNRQTLLEMKQALWEIWQDEKCRALVITGAGEKAFVAGADISEMAQMGVQEALEFAELGHAVTNMIETMPKAVIAAVNGYALGGGTELAISCDVIIASSRAVFGQPEVKLGIIPGFGGTIRLARLIGRAKAMEWILSGKTYTAQEALHYGLVSKVVEPENLMKEALDLAKTIASRGPLAVKTAKRLVHEGISMPLMQALRLEAVTFANLFATQDQKEGMKAFLEKRNPSFQGK